jgi:TIR domain-containing protein/pentapeptide repeat protein
MANPEHLQILQQGVVVWKRWRYQHEDITLDLGGADLRDADLGGVDLSRVNLGGANLGGANLHGANLREANLYGADLREANLGRAKLGRADLSGANLGRANLAAVRLYETVFSDTDLTAVRGLETCRHYGPSTLDHRTLAKSGPFPLAFLRGCGLPDILIDYLPSLLGEPIQYDSLFISYASRDQAFAERLYADLQNKGVRCWYAPEDMKIGDEFRSRIDASIHLHDRLLLILSEHSIKSRWVQKEVETAFEKETKEHRLVLFPIRLDDAVMQMTVGWAADIRRQRHIGDFTQWKEHDAYQYAFTRLLRDLTTAERQPGR